MRVYDVSPTLSHRTAVFPGDASFRRDEAMSFEKGHHLSLSSISTTLHIGSHADSSSHYSANGKGIDKRGLEHYVGRAYVAKANVERGERVSFEALSLEARRKIDSNDALPSHFLIWTGTFPEPDVWNSDFASYDPKLIERLAARGVITIGIDTPSIDPETSKLLESHQTIARLNLAVLEGLCLDGVPEGEYTLMAQPLKIEGGDAGPVRALLFAGKLVEENFEIPLSYNWVECEKKPKV